MIGPRPLGRHVPLLAAAALAFSSPAFPALQGAAQQPNTGSVEAPSAHQEIERGAAHLRKGRTAEAIAALKAALAIQPASAVAHQLLGEAYLQQGGYDMLGEARAELLQAVALDPSLVWARFHLARLYLDFGEAGKARDQLAAAVQQRPDVPHLQSLLGEAQRQLDDPKQSVERQKRALELDPAFTPARYYLGLALIDLKQDEAALAALEAAASSNLAVPELYLALGSLHERAGRLDRAREQFERAVKIAPDRSEARLRLAAVHRRQGHPEVALAELERAMPSGKRLLTTEYYQRLESDVYVERGRALQALERWTDAADAYRRALDVLPDRGDAHKHLAEVLYQHGDYRPALEHARRASALGDPVAADLLARITQEAGR